MTFSVLIARVFGAVLTMAVASTLLPVTAAQKQSGNGALYLAQDATMNATSSAAFPPSVDGWHRWEVAAIKGVPQWCCTTWRDGQLEGDSCSIDPHSRTYTKTDARSYGKTGNGSSMQVFALIEQGGVSSVQVFGDRCEVTSRRSITDHQRVDTTISLRWLEGQLKKNRKVLGAIAVHDLPRAQQVLVETARTGREETRKDAIFWMGQVRANASRGELVRLLEEDPSEEIREHTIFSVSQSSLNDRMDLVERVAMNDHDPDVRGQAWFWMSQAGKTNIETRIRQGMKRESNIEVLEQAVFALSQLKHGDGVNALIRLVEDPQQKRAVRKKALFWLGQDGSEPALEYLSTVLGQ